MLAVLAQVKAPQVDQQAVRGFLDQANQWLSELPNRIGQIDLAVAGVLLVLGIVSLLYGLRIVKGVVIVYSSIIGSAIGLSLATEVFHRGDLWWVGLLGGGVLMALLAWPLANIFIGIYGAMAGGLAGYAVTHAVGDERTMLLGVAVGVIIGGILAAVVFRFMVIVMTSVLGAHLAVVAAVAMLYRVEKIAGPLKDNLSEQRYLLPLLTAVPALVGIVYQLYRSEGREADQDGGAESQDKE